MKSFFRKVSSDSIPFKGKNKRHKVKPEPNITGNPNEGLLGGGNNITIENCPNFHFGNTIKFSTTNIIGSEAAPPDIKSYSSQTVPKNVKENFSNISEVTIEHFELVSLKINDVKSLKKKLDLTEDQFQSSVDELQNEFYVCEMLHSWKKAKTREATVGLLLRVLWEVKEYDAAIYLCENL